ncbi:Protein CBG07809 [Caenorhabditis briggsae]|uniref:Protein CBG07809 n=1 Tax=Caenorhabditis briggsae TaxID=6238 RepID=A8X576_CAEBR|nr:Protein CBG07809 [Caenorhabditis briggsae]CAP27775.1 Protein CBG07809 [Caenorhabditis briggsae]
MSLTAEPASCTIPANGGTSSLKIANSGTDKLIFKIKSSNNKDYRIQPVFGFVEPSEFKEVTVIRLSGPPKEDKIVIHFSIAPVDVFDASAAFATVTPAGTFTIPMSAT